MSQKTIQFNPQFLSMSGSKSSANKTLKRERKEKPLITMNPNKVKKQLIDKIKTFQLKEKENDILEKTKEEEEKMNIEKDFNNDFNNSVKFLEELSKKEKEKNNNKNNRNNRKKNTTLKTGKIENEIKMQIETELPPEMKIPFKSSYTVYAQPPVSAPPVQVIAPPVQVIAPPVQVIAPPVKVIAPPVQVSAQQVPAQQVSAQQVSAQQVSAQQVSAQQVSAQQVIAQPPPQYSNLKNSALPTFRQWKNNTQKNYNNNQDKPSIKIDDYIKNNEQTERSIALENLKNDYKNNNNIENTDTIDDAENIELTLEKTPIINKQIPKKRRHRITKTHKYTLGRTGSKVSVLIKNAKTRKLVQHELALLKQKGIPEIKTFLRKKNLLKVGSDAPNDVLRQIYEQSILSGDIENKAKDVLIHNYMNH